MTFKSKAYLTIDDSASARMDDLTGYLERKGIPAIFYCRGDRLAENPGAAIRAMQKGFTFANHTYSHKRSSEESFEWIVQDIEACQKLLDQLHVDAGVTPKGKYFRFPHVDRGTSGWIVDYDLYDDDQKNAIITELANGVNVPSMDRPGASSFEKKDRLQNHLRQSGYTDPFKDVTHRWYSSGEIGEAFDSLFTFSNCDWMLTARQMGKWPYKSVEDLKQKALSDPWLNEGGSVNVILAHDQAEIVDITIELIEDLAENGMEFLEVSE